MSNLTLESLIKEHKDRIPSLRNLGDAFCPYYEYPNMEAYHIWLATTQRYMEIHYPKDKQIIEFESTSKEVIFPNQQNKLLAILEAFALLPTVITTQARNKKSERDSINVTTTINNTNNQSQIQEQSLTVNLFLEAIKDDLTGRQIKELKAVVSDADNDLQKARPNILAKLKEFGNDVASNIVANILTNPIIWGGL